jgi:hypothetical protein
MGRRRSLPSLCAAYGVIFFFAFLCALPAAPFQVRDFGARGDKSTNDTAAIQAAVDACSRAGGGEVVFSAGDYLAGKVTLKRNVTLKLEAGATIWASSKPEDYASSPGPKGEWYLFVAENQENIAITGQGAIQGVGKDDLDRRGDPEGQPLPPHRFGIIHFSGCTNVHLRQVTIYYSDWHTVTFVRCERVFVSALSIINNFYHTNSDGIDPVSCKDVFISDCYVIAGDDAICPKTEHGHALENMVVENCILESVATAIKLGTGSSGDFRDIKVSNCVIRNSGVGLGIFIKDGGTAERVSFSNVSIETTRQDAPINTRLRNNIIPIYIDIEQRNDQARVGAVRDVTFSQIQINSDNGILIQGMPERAIESLTLRDIVFWVSQGYDFSGRKKRAGGRSNAKDARITRFIRQPTYLALAYIDGLVVDNVRLVVKEEVARKFDRSALALFASKNAVIKDVQRQPDGMKGSQPVITLDDCQQVLVANCLALPGTPTFLGLSGKETRSISLAGNDVTGARKAVIQGREVPADAVRGSK